VPTWQLHVGHWPDGNLPRGNSLAVHTCAERRWKLKDNSALWLLRAMTSGALCVRVDPIHCTTECRRLEVQFESVSVSHKQPKACIAYSVCCWHGGELFALL
jgi:hypothetical protein